MRLEFLGNPLAYAQFTIRGISLIDVMELRGDKQELSRYE